MEIQLVVTKTDFCLPNLEHECQDLGLNYQVKYIEDNPELVSSYNIKHSPNVFIDGLLAFRYQPTEQELKGYLASH